MKLKKMIAPALIGVFTATSLGLAISSLNKPVFADSTDTVTLVHKDAVAPNVGPSSSSTDKATWNTDQFTLEINKNKSVTKINLTYTEWRIYASHSLVFTPKSGYMIDSVIANATSNSYASVFKSESTGLTNCIVSVPESSSVVTITPTNKNEAFTIVLSAQTRVSQMIVSYSSTYVPTTYVPNIYADFSTGFPSGGILEEGTKVTKDDLYVIDDNLEEYTNYKTYLGTGTITDDGEACADFVSRTEVEYGVTTYTKADTVLKIEANDSVAEDDSSKAVFFLELDVVDPVIASLSRKNSKTDYIVGESLDIGTITATTISDMTFNMDVNDLVVDLELQDKTKVKEDVLSTGSYNVTKEDDGKYVQVTTRSSKGTASPVTISSRFKINVRWPSDELKIKKIGESGTESWTLVEAEKDDWTGEYAIATSDGIAWTGVDAVNGVETLTIDGNNISAPTVYVKIAQMTDGYSVQVVGGTNDGKYISGTSKSNKLNFSDTASLNTISFNESGNTVLLTSDTSKFIYNGGKSDANRYRYYKSSTTISGDFKLPCLWEHHEGGEGITLTEDVVNICATSNSLLDGECSALDVKSTTWTTIEDMFTEEQKVLLKDGVANSEGNQTERFLSRYDFIVAKYGYSDFLNRGIVSAANRGLNGTINNDLIPIVIIVSIFGITTLGALYYIKRKRAN